MSTSVIPIFLPFADILAAATGPGTAAEATPGILALAFAATYSRVERDMADLEVVDGVEEADAFCAQSSEHSGDTSRVEADFYLETRTEGGYS